MNVLSNLIVVIISQYINIYQLITLCILKLHCMSISVNLKKKTKTNPVLSVSLPQENS